MDDGWVSRSKRSKHACTRREKKRTDDVRGTDVLLFCAECMRIQSFLSGDKSDRIHAAMPPARPVPFRRW